MVDARNNAKADLFDYIKCFYNPKRCHLTLGYHSPNEYETKVGLPYSAIRKPAAGHIEAGIITPTTKARLMALEEEKEKLEGFTPEPVLPVIHPNLASRYRRKVEELEALLTDPATAHEAMSAIRSPIDRIVINPGERRGAVEMEVFGEMAVLLGLSDGTRGVRLSVVAGARYQRYLPTLRCRLPFVMAKPIANRPFDFGQRL